MDLVQADFKEEGHHQWVAYKKGYRILVRRYDGGYEVIIRAELVGNPTAVDWEKALEITNRFYSELRAGQKFDMSEGNHHHQE